jgi:hypothetical protein
MKISRYFKCSQSAGELNAVVEKDVVFHNRDSDRVFINVEKNLKL